MLRLRPYKRMDADRIVSWVTDEWTHRMWSADRFDHFPITGEELDAYIEGYAYTDWFYPFCAFDDEGLAAYLVMRFTDAEKWHLHFGFIIVDSERRGQGIGQELISLCLAYAFTMLKAKVVDLGVFEHNARARRCYEACGFTYTGSEPTCCDFDGSVWRFVEMAIERDVWERRQQAPAGA